MSEHTRAKLQEPRSRQEETWQGDRRIFGEDIPRRDARSAGSGRSCALNSMCRWFPVLSTIELALRSSAPIILVNRKQGKSSAP